MNAPSTFASVLLASSGWGSILIVLLVLACPLSMWLMMRGKNKGGGSNDR